ILARRERQRGDGLRLVHLAVAEHAPHVTIAHRRDPAMLDVAHEARLVDRADRPDAHRPGRELPEVRHQPWMRIRRQSATADLLPLVRERLPATPALDARI